MKRLLSWLSLLVLLGIPLALGTAVYLCFQDEPLVRRATEFKPDDVERAVRLLQKHDPRRDEERHAAHADDSRRRPRSRGQLSGQPVWQGQFPHRAATWRADARGERRRARQSVRTVPQRPGDAARDRRVAGVRALAHRPPAAARLARRLGARPRAADARSHRRSTRLPPTPSAASASRTEACAWSTSGATICPPDWAR